MIEKNVEETVRKMFLATPEIPFPPRVWRAIIGTDGRDDKHGGQAAEPATSATCRRPDDGLLLPTSTGISAVRQR